MKGQRYKVYLEDEDRGVKLNDVWQIPYLGSTSKERADYPTRKSFDLLKRIVLSSCPSDGLVLDPFCGCRTTIHAAQIPDRHWIGIDVCVNVGIFTCFEERVTRNMKDAATRAGRFMNAPVVQIYTVEDYFAGRKPKMPLAA